MKKIHYNKLIRDRIPEKIAKAGATCSTKKLDQKSFSKELTKKVGEESDGLLVAKSRKEYIS